MKTANSKYLLNVLATPIGNIKEVSERFLECLNNADVILCEDTRVTKKLLACLKIIKKMELIVINEQTESQQINKIINLIKNGLSVCLLSDAGYPLVSDPGYKLIKACIADEIAINVINGPCSIIHALVGSGMCEHEFLFLGFLGKTKTERIKKLTKYKNLQLPIVVFESVHRLTSCLNDMLTVLGPQQEICLAKELTKLHEEFIYTNLKDIQNMSWVLKGEYVIVINNKPILTKIDDEQINKEIDLLLKTYKTKDVSKIICKKYGIDSKVVYNKIVKQKS